MDNRKLIEDKEYLKLILNNPNWWKSGDTVLTVASTLNRWGMFTDTSQVIDYFEKPWKFERDMKFIIEEL